MNSTRHCQSRPVNKQARISMQATCMQTEYSWWQSTRTNSNSRQPCGPQQKQLVASSLLCHSPANRAKQKLFKLATLVGEVIRVNDEWLRLYIGIYTAPRSMSTRIIYRCDGVRVVFARACHCNFPLMPSSVWPAV